VVFSCVGCVESDEDISASTVTKGCEKLDVLSLEGGGVWERKDRASQNDSIQKWGAVTTVKAVDRSKYTCVNGWAVARRRFC
jgi:hypothetical protein